jgi:hypothetical protein
VVEDPAIYRWMSGAGWATLTSYETMKVKAVNHKPMNYPKGNPRPLGRGGGQQSSSLTLDIKDSTLLMKLKIKMNIPKFQVEKLRKVISL